MEGNNISSDQRFKKMIERLKGGLQAHTTAPGCLLWFGVTLSGWLLGVPKSDDPVVTGIIGLIVGSGFARSMDEITAELRDLPALLNREFTPVEKPSPDWSGALYFLDLLIMIWHCIFGVPKFTALEWLGCDAAWVLLVAHRTIDEIVQHLRAIKATLREESSGHGESHAAGFVE